MNKTYNKSFVLLLKCGSKSLLKLACTTYFDSQLFFPFILPKHEIVHEHAITIQVQRLLPSYHGLTTALSPQWRSHLLRTLHRHSSHHQQSGSLKNKIKNIRNTPSKGQTKSTYRLWQDTFTTSYLQIRPCNARFT